MADRRSTQHSPEHSAPQAVTPSVDVNEVGQAEQVVNRLIHERQALMAMADVLKTYRMVCTELPALAQELKNKQDEMNTVNNQLNRLIDEKSRRIQEIDTDCEGYRATAIASVQQKIESVEHELAELDKMKSTESIEYERAKVQHEDELERLRVAIQNAQSELASVRQEHAALAEMFSKAASAFR